MTVKRAAVLGRCMGVRRAVEMAFATAERERQGEGRRVYTLGPLIHNPTTVAELEARGIFSITAGDRGFFLERQGSGEGRNCLDLRGSVVIIRAHGVPPLLRARLGEAGAEIVDATCPRVIASQRKAEAYAKKGWTVVIAGDRDHGEVTGIAGFAPGALIVGNAGEAVGIRAPGPVALIAQTTIKEEEYKAIRDSLGKVLEAGGQVLEVVDSICPATAERLASLAELAEDCDALVVVGGRNSANTMRLQATARELGRPSWLVEGPEELPPEIFAFARVGVTAGASTPDEAIEEVEAALLSAPGRAGTA